jgi:hypothetical protein
MFRCALRSMGKLMERADAGGWMMMLAGVAILAITILAAPLIELRAMQHQHDMLAEKAQTLQRQHDSYTQIVEGLDATSPDPLLVQRLAWFELHLKPVGTHPLGDRLPGDPDHGAHFERWESLSAARTPAAVGPDIPQSRLVRLTTGRKRPLVLVLGTVLIGMGMITSLRRTPGQSR